MSVIIQVSFMNGARAVRRLCLLPHNASSSGPVGAISCSGRVTALLNSTVGTVIPFIGCYGAVWPALYYHCLFYFDARTRAVAVSFYTFNASAVASCKFHFATSCCSVTFTSTTNT